MRIQTDILPIAISYQNSAGKQGLLALGTNDVDEQASAIELAEKIIQIVLWKRIEDFINTFYGDNAYRAVIELEHLDEQITCSYVGVEDFYRREITPSGLYRSDTPARVIMEEPWLNDEYLDYFSKLQESMWVRQPYVFMKA